MNIFSQIPILRICVTERCQSKCLYCRPGGEAAYISQKPELNVYEIGQLVAILAERGIAHLKITGGEPLLYEDIPGLIRSLRAIAGVETIQLVTRSPMAGRLAFELKDAGLSEINFSMDSLDPGNWANINGKNGLSELLQAVRQVYDAGLKLKFNMVIMKENYHEVPTMVEFVGQFGATLKLLDLINIPQDRIFFQHHYVCLDMWTEFLAKQSVNQDFNWQPGGLGTPMPRFMMPNGATVLVKDATIGTWYGDVCRDCKNYPCQDAIMALRLTADGQLQKCLYRKDNLVNLRSSLDVSNSHLNKLINEILVTYKHAKFYPEAWHPKF